MEDIELVTDEQETCRHAQERMRLKFAFGDDAAQRFLKMRGIVGAAMQEAVLERYASKQADRIARNAIATAAYIPAARGTEAEFPEPMQGDDEVDLADMI